MIITYSLSRMMEKSFGCFIVTFVEQGHKSKLPIVYAHGRLSYEDLKQPVAFYQIEGDISNDSHHKGSFLSLYQS